MKTFIIAFAFVVTGTTFALAENPYVGMPEQMAEEERAEKSAGADRSSQWIDYTAPASVDSPTAPSDGSENRFGDASPHLWQ